MKKVFSLFATVLTVAFSVAALDVTNVTPGQLQSQINDAANVTSLSVSGAVNAADLYFIGSQCPALTSLNLSGATIEAYNGKALNSLTQYPEATIPATVFAGSALRSIVFPASQQVTIENGAFASSQLTSVNLTNVAKIGAGAFASCPNLASLTIGNSVLDEAVFMDCNALVEANLTGLTATGKSMFARCSALASVVGSESLMTIDDAAFSACQALESFAFGTSLAKIGNDAFARSGLRVADMAQCSSLRSIGNWAFAQDNNLVSVILPDDVNEIGQGAFFECKAMVDYSTPSNVKNLGSYALAGNTSVNASNLVPEGVETIEPYALANLTHISTLKLPSTLKYIGDGAMQNMTSLDTLNAESINDVPELGENVWQGVDQSIVTLLVPKNSYSAYASAPQWTEFNISGVTGVDDIKGETLAQQSKVMVRFIGSLLQVQAVGDAQISTISLFDIAGRKLIESPVADSFVQIETASHQGNFFVAYVKLADGTNAAIKLARNK